MNPAPAGWFIEPCSGELLEASTDALKDARRAGWDEIGRIKEALRPIQAELAVRAGPATLPPRRYRTDIQNATASCPRCGGHGDGFVDESAGAE